MLSIESYSMFAIVTELQLL